MEATEKINTIEGNKLIAHFMNFEHEGETLLYYHNGEPSIKPDLEYDTEWNWLMPVVEKIEQTGIYSKMWYNLEFDRYEAHFFAPGHTVEFIERGPDRITTVYLAVLQFITWHNSKHGSPGETKI